MNHPRHTRTIWLTPILAAFTLIANASVAGTASLGNALRCTPDVQASETGAAPLSPLARARRDCPVLGAILEEYAAIDLGEASAEGANLAPSPELVLATRFAASGDIRAMARHARLAREGGTPPAAIRELLYLTAVNGGIPKAMEATQTLTEVLTPITAASLSANREACARPVGTRSFLEN
jgi:4-carboxymuconolactone decarboxylase